MYTLQSRYRSKEDTTSSPESPPNLLIPDMVTIWSDTQSFSKYLSIYFILSTGVTRKKVYNPYL